MTKQGSRFLLGLAAFVVVGSALHASASPALGATGLYLTDITGTRVDKIERTIPAELTSLSIPLLVAQDTDAAIADVRVIAVLGGAQVQVAALGGAPDAAITVPAHGNVGIRLDVSGLDKEGTVTGELVVVSSAGVDSLASLSFTKTVNEDISIAEAVDGKLSFTNVGTHWLRELTLVSARTETTTVTLSDLTLLDDRSNPAQVKVMQETTDLTGGGQITLGNRDRKHISLEANFVGVGTYAGTLTTTAGGRPTDWPVSIAVTGDTLSIEIDDPADIRAETGQKSTGSYDLVITGRDTSGRPLVLEPPQVKVVRQEGTSSFYAKSSFAPSGSLPVAGYGKFQVDGTLSGITDPGQYRVTITFPQAQGTLPTATFDIFVRLPWWVAAIVIGVGIVAGFVLRFLVVEGRTKLIVRRGLYRLAERVAAMKTAASNADDIGVAASVEQVLSEMIKTDRPRPDEAGLLVLGGKVDLLKRYLATSSATRESGFEHGNRIKLDGVREYLESDRSDSTETGAKSTTLAEIEATLRRQRELARTIIGVRAAVAARRAANRPGEPEKLAAVDAKLAATLETIRAGRVEDALAGIAESVGLWRTILLEAAVADYPDSPHPPGFTEQTWQAARQTFTAKLATARDATNPLEGLRVYEEAARELIGALAARLAVVTKDRVAALPADPANDEMRKTLTAIAVDAQKVADTSPSGDSETLRAEYDSVVARYRAATPQPGGRDLFRAGRAPTAGTFGPTAAGLDLTVVGAEPSFGDSRRATEILIAGGSVATYALVIAAGVASGLLLLWANNSTWGSAADVLIAFLWGMGLHQVGESTFTGANGILKAVRDYAQ